MMTAPTVEGQLICASNMAFQVEDGKVRPYPPFDAGAGFCAAPIGFVAGKRGINAALVGRTLQGPVLAFRGSLPGPEPDPVLKILADWLQVAHVKLVIGRGLPGRVHQGFLQALDGLWGQIDTAVISALNESSSKHLYITGHSAGGALAHMAAARFSHAKSLSSRWADVKITAISFGAPRYADAAFKVEYEASCVEAIRYENRDDLTPHIPPSARLLAPLKARLGPVANFASWQLPTEYVSTGTLRFIDWHGAICADSFELQKSRVDRLVCLLLLRPDSALKQIHEDHLISCIEHGPSGYLQAVFKDFDCGTHEIAVQALA